MDRIFLAGGGPPPGILHDHNLWLVFGVVVVGIVLCAVNDIFG